MTTLLLVDDHHLLRQGLRRGVEEAGFAVVGEAGDGAEALRLVEELHPDLVLMDVTMPVLDGIEATRQLRDRAPGTRVVILTMHGEEETVERALRAGAIGYLVKDCTIQQVAETLHAAAGDTDLSSGLATSMLGQLKAYSHLSDGSAGPPGTSLRRSEPAAPVLSRREEEVLQLFADGWSTTEVARRLYISPKTVKNHLASIYDKLDAGDRTQAVITGVRMGIIRLG
jgi:two-component system, NarL family, response regulator DegU